MHLCLRNKGSSQYMLLDLAFHNSHQPEDHQAGRFQRLCWGVVYLMDITDERMNLIVSFDSEQACLQRGMLMANPG